MSEANLIPDSVRRIYTEGFRAGDIAEPLVSFDDATPVDDIAAFMEKGSFDAVGVRRDGLVTGFVERAGMRVGTCGEFARGFSDDMLVAESDSLSAVVRVLARHARAFVTAFGAIGGIITRDDFEKPPVRMWLFGMVTMIEMRYTRLIGQLCPDDTWRQHLSEGRVSKAEDLLAERRRRNQAVSFLDCLQLSDKGQVIARNETIRRLTVFESRGQAEEGIKLLEGLRNNLAHAQDISSTNWPAIERLSHHIDQLI